MKILFSFLLFVISNQVLAQNEFNLLSVHKKSEINYLTIKNINNFPVKYDSLMEGFKPVKGEFTVYLFMKTFKGLSVRYSEDENSETLVDFHDLIVLKTNSKSEILDGFYYRLEWAEPPNQYMLFRSFAEKVILKDDLPLSDLNFLNEYEIHCGGCMEEIREMDFFKTDILKFK